ncbi:MAG: hotdog domain-containing protein [Finegoldia sp.]|nr:hotdog domain-containing protein [Finegoldia sp.]
MKTRSATKTKYKFRVNKNMTNFYGFMHGGELFKMMDTVAGICTRNFCENPTLTRATNNLSYIAPSYIGDIITVTAIIDHTGRTSMECFVEARGENGDLRASGYFTMVSVDENKKSREIPSLILESEDDRRAFAMSEKRKALYKEMASLKDRYE